MAEVEPPLCRFYGNHSLGQFIGSVAKGINESKIVFILKTSVWSLQVYHRIMFCVLAWYAHLGCIELWLSFWVMFSHYSLFQQPLDSLWHFNWKFYSRSGLFNRILSSYLLESKLFLPSCACWVPSLPSGLWFVLTLFFSPTSAIFSWWTAFCGEQLQVNLCGSCFWPLGCLYSYVKWKLSVYILVKKLKQENFNICSPVVCLCPYTIAAFVSNQCIIRTCWSSKGHWYA